jgi:hypothetical protein
MGSKVSSQKFENAAKRGKLGDAYLYYKVLSGDAAHPSISGMTRYVQLGQNREMSRPMYFAVSDHDDRDGEILAFDVFLYEKNGLEQ